MTKLLLSVWTLLLPGLGNAEPDIHVRGLFADRVLIEIAGENRFLRAGEVTPEGIVLVSSNSRSAIIRISGVEKEFYLSGHIASEFTESAEKTVKIPQGSDSPYRVLGAINGKSVEMIVDTGATAVAMNASEAERLGIRYREGQTGKTATASGMVESYLVDLQRISVGSIEVNNIKAVVIPGEFPQQILLGNTFLKHVTMVQEAGALVLKSKF